MTVINGTSADDILYGTSSADEIYGFEGDDTLNGGSGNDILVGGSGADVLNGGTGYDTVDYSTSTAAVDIDLISGVGSGGDAEGDSYTGIEYAVGSAYDDTLSSNTNGGRLTGGAGNDVYVTGRSNSYVDIVEAAGEGEGDDEIQTSYATYSMAGFANVERLTYTGVGNATLTGNSGDNILTGNTGNDTLIGGAGADQLIGGSGTDTASYYGSSSVTVNLKTGLHTGDAAGDTFDSIEKLTGSNYADTFVSGSEAIILNGGSGADTVDYSASGAAVDINLTAGTGSGGDAEGDSYTSIEYVAGSAFGDTLRSTTNGTTLAGGDGDDVYVVSSVVNVVEDASEGDDEIQTNSTVFSLQNAANVERLTYLGTSNVTFTGNAEDNTLTGGSGNDTLNGGEGSDTLNGGSGNDTLIGGAGADHLVGGAGTDYASYAGSSAVAINLKTGAYTGDALGDSFDNIEGFIGSSYADTFVSGSEAIILNGGSGADTVDYSASGAAVDINLTAGTGSGGDAEGDSYTSIEYVAGSAFGDTLRSTTNGTTLAGGDGDDVYVVSSVVNVVEDAGEGDDEIQTNSTVFSLQNAANVERLTYLGTSNVTFTGNAEDNTLTGGSGNDTLIGGAGADQLIGGSGTDTASYYGSSSVTVNLKTGLHTGDAAGDTFDSIEKLTGSNYADTFVSGSEAIILNGGSGADTVDYSASGAAVDINLTAGTGSGGDAEGDSYTSIEYVAGSAFGDTLRSTTNGTTLAGGDGDDVYVVSSVVNVVEDASEGDDEIQTNSTVFSLQNAANVERLTYLGTSNVTFTGNAEDNTLTGGSGNDTLNGGEGSDTLNGGSGNDTLIGGAGADHLVGGAGTDTVSYVDSSVAMTFNLATGIFTGIGAGDTVDGVEWISGTNYGDTFIASANADLIIGGSGVDRMSYENATSAISFNLSTGTHTGIAAGDTLGNVEIIQGTAYNDSFTGDTGSNNFVGGAGADVFDGGSGSDSVWYLTSSSAVDVNLSTGTASGGDAAGDTFTSIERLIGSDYDDTLTGDDNGNRLEGGAGNDTITGGAANDIIYGDIGSDVGAVGGASSSGQVDIIHGGAGNDTIYSAENDNDGQYRTEIYGDDGMDTIYVNTGAAIGGSGNDTLTGENNQNVAYILDGGAGDDILFLKGLSGLGFGGNGSDDYHISSSLLSKIQDDGTVGTDSLYIDLDDGGYPLQYGRVGDDAFITTKSDIDDNGQVDSGVLLLDWYAGYDTIENFFDANGSGLTLDFDQFL